MKSKSKILWKIIPIMLITLLGLNFVLVPFVQAQNFNEATTTAGAGQAAASADLEKQGGRATYFVLKAASGLMWLFTTVAAFFLTLIGSVLDTANALNAAPLINEATADAIYGAWGMVKDLTYLFFIFILLVIAIATILGWETYGIKTMLPKLIIIVLLINFSLLFTQYVVEFSNGLADFMFEKIKNQSPPSDIAGKETTLSGAIMAAFDYNSLVPYIEANKEKIKDDVQSATGNTSTTTQNNSTPVSFLEERFTTETQTAGIGWLGNKIANPFKWFAKKTYDYAIAPVGGAFQAVGSFTKTMIKGPTKEELTEATVDFAVNFLIFIATMILIFVFIVLTVLLFVRAAVLAILAVTAPLAFLLYVTPGASGMWNYWWRQLFSNSFFYPAVLFFILVTIVYAQGLVNTFVYMGARGHLSTIFSQIFIVAIMLLLSVYAAKSIGAQGASVAMSFGGKAKGMAMGAAQRTAILAPGYGLQRGKQWLEEKSLGKGTGAKIAGAFMGAGKAARYIATGKTPEEDKEDIKRRFMKYNVGDLPDMYSKATGKTRAAIAELYKDLSGGKSIKTALPPPPMAGGWGSGIIGRMLKRGLGIAPKTSAKEGGSKKTAEGGHGGGEYDADKEEWEKRK